jgi:hypothetical protein
MSDEAVFLAGLKKQQDAEEAYMTYKRGAQIERAKKARSRSQVVFRPGEAVMVWRRGTGTTRREGRGSSDGPWAGQWKGVGRVLAQQSKQLKDENRPRPVIWVVIGGRLLRCAPEHLRHASRRETMLDEIGKPINMPWTFEQTADSINKGEFTDLLKDPIPSHDEVVHSETHIHEDSEPFPWRQDVTTETETETENQSRRTTTTDRDEQRQPRQRDRTPPRPLRRITTKTSSKVRFNDTPDTLHEDTMTDIQEIPDTVQLPDVPEFPPLIDDTNMTDDIETERERSRSPPRQGLTMMGFNAVKQGFAFIELDITPKNQHGWRNLGLHAQAFVTTQLRRQRIEVNLNRLTKDESDKFNTAKDKEVQQWLKYEVVKAVSKQYNIPEGEVMKMRWVCTWKPEKTATGEFTGKDKAKARLVILGFQDPDLGSPNQETASPTPSRTSRQVFLTCCAHLKFWVESGDVSTAFLQGRALESPKYTYGVPELCAALKVPPNTVLRIMKGAYGLTTAPREWFETVKIELIKLGFLQSKTEPCCWTYSCAGEIKGIVLFHVDDFLLAGNHQCKFWQAMRAKLQTTWTWSPWESGEFTICGIEITQHADCSFTIHQKKYTSQIEPIPISTARRKLKTSPITENERSQLRGVNGALQWLSTQSNPKVSAELSLSQSKVNTATVQDLLDANKLLHRAKTDLNVDIHLKGVHPDNIGVVAWGDAAWANRPDGSSTGGTFVGIADIKALERGEMTHINLVSWKTQKLKRKSRSSTAAEIQAISDCEDEAYFVKVMLASFLGYNISREERDKTLSWIPCFIVTDSKSLFDAHKSQTGGLGMEEKRSALEMVDLRERMTREQSTLKWVNSEANVADSLTKPGARKPLESFFENNCCWAITKDPLERSARKRKEVGLQPLTATEQTDTEDRPQDETNNETDNDDDEYPEPELPIHQRPQTETQTKSQTNS